MKKNIRYLIIMLAVLVVLGLYVLKGFSGDRRGEHGRLH